jgi:hypothetical protein
MLNYNKYISLDADDMTKNEARFEHSLLSIDRPFPLSYMCFKNAIKDAITDIIT